MADVGAVGVNRTAASTHDPVVRLGAMSYPLYRRYTAVQSYGTVVARSLAYHKDTPASAFINRTLRAYRLLPWWIVDARPLHTIPINGTISGVLDKSGMPEAGGYICLYYRATGILIGRQRVGSDGTFSFGDLDPSDLYFIVGFDTDTPPTAFNAKVLDFLSPVPV